LMIILDGMMKYMDFFERTGFDKLYVTTFHREGIAGKQLVVEYTGYRGGYVYRGGGIENFYRLADRYIDQIKIGEKTTLLINGGEVFDLGFSLKMLEHLTREKSVGNILYLVEVPQKKSTTDAKAFFYAWFKTISLIDIYFNELNKGFFKIILFDYNQPPQLYGLINNLYEKTSLFDKTCSTIHLRVRRFLTGLRELFILTELFKTIGFYNYLTREYKADLSLLNSVLDHAPSELWSIARRDVHVIRGSIYTYKKLVDKGGLLEKVVRDLVKTIVQGGKYTSLMVDPLHVLEKILSGTRLSKIYDEIGVGNRVRDLISIPDDQLIDTYTYGVGSTRLDEFRISILSRDLAVYLHHVDNVVELADQAGEAVIMDASHIPINMDCRINQYYIPLDYYEAYVDKAGLNIEHMYPKDLHIGDKPVDQTDLHRINLVNYHGYHMALSENRRFSGLKTIKDLLQ